MNPMDILGSLLGQKSSSGSPGGNILKDILAGQQAGRSPSPRPTPQSRSRTPEPRGGQRPRTIGDAARGLEDLLNVSDQQYQRRQSSPPVEPASPATTTARDQAANQQALMLIRAMVSAAKADGKINPQEQAEITQRMQNLSRDDIEFLREEFSRPLNVREIAWDTPLGMEEQVYVLSLIAMDLDENKEAEYLADLAHGLRLQPDRCNELHRQYNAPTIFR